MNVQLKVLDKNIDTSTPEGKFFFTIIGAVAEFERSLIVSRTRDGPVKSGQGLGNVCFQTVRKIVQKVRDVLVLSD